MLFYDKGKMRRIKIKVVFKGNTSKTYRSKLFDCYIASLSPVAAATKGTLVDLSLVDGNNKCFNCNVVFMLHRISNNKP